jgi:hypothetical protein
MTTSRKCLEVDMDSIQLQNELVDGLTQELCKVIENYEGTIRATTVLGVLDIIKHSILMEIMEESNE